ncbi:MAG: N-acetylmuramoyl-L-alanine amidase [Bacteroides sp.]
MGNSKLADCTIYSPNHSGRRTRNLDTITPHCVVGQLTAESIAGCFPKGREASCNYGIGRDGRVSLIVDECNRSWCTSSNANDQRAITIECASDMTAPYTMNTAVYEKLIKLCVDICKRNGKTKVLWLGSKEDTLTYQPKSNEMVLTAHRWFANKSCPGDWLYSRYGDLANRINAVLGNAAPIQPEKPAATDYPEAPFAVKVLISNLNIRKGPGANFAVTGRYTGKGIFTVTEEKSGWGKLKSGIGWIYLENPAYCTIQASKKKSAEAIAKEVISGKWGNGDARKKRLQAAGYDYAAVQKKVDELMR